MSGCGHIHLLSKIILSVVYVLDPISGWCEIRPYNSEVWSFLRASFKCNFFLLSATVEEDSLARILGKIIDSEDNSGIQFYKNVEPQVWGNLEQAFFIRTIL